MIKKRRNQPHVSTKQVLTLTGRQRAFRLHQPEGKSAEQKTTNKTQKR